MINHEAFEKAREKVINTERQRFGIGTLSEKTTHAILKNYYEPDCGKQEVTVDGYVADIFANEAIIEIQTAQFNRLRKKLSAFLPCYPVTVVYPIPYEKWIIWINEETGELSRRRKSPAKGNVYGVFPELYKIKMFLNDPNLSLKLVLLSVEECRIFDGWSADRKRKASRTDYIPLRILEEISISEPDDFLQFLSADLVMPFTSRDFARAANIRATLAQLVVHILRYVGVLDQVGKSGRMLLYSAKN